MIARLVAALVVTTSVFFLAPSQSRAAPAIDKMAVMPLAAKRFPQESVEILDELLLNDIHRRGKFKVVAAADINAMLGFEKMRSALGCDDLSCAAEIGGALGVEKLLAGSVSKLGNQVIVSLTLIDIVRNDVANRSQVKIADEESLYSYAIEAAVARLLGEPVPKPPTSQAPSTPEPDTAPARGPEPTAPPQPMSSPPSTSNSIDRRDEPEELPRLGVQFMVQHIPSQQGQVTDQMSVFLGPRLLARALGPLYALLQAGYVASGREAGYGRHGLMVGLGLEGDLEVLPSPRLTLFARATFDILVSPFNEKDAFPVEQYDLDSAFIAAFGVRFMNIVEVSGLVGQRYFPGFGGGIGVALGHMW